MNLVKRNTIVTVDNKWKYLVMGRMRYMGADYYPAKQLDQKNCPIHGLEVMLCAEDEDDDFDFRDEWDDDESPDVYLEVLNNRKLEELLWAIFYEQKMGEWF